MHRRHLAFRVLEAAENPLDRSLPLELGHFIFVLVLERIGALLEALLLLNPLLLLLLLLIRRLSA